MKFNLKSLISFFFILFICLFVYRCKETVNKNVTGFKITDDLKNEISFDAYPKKVVSLAPNITETIYLLNADSLLTGVTKYCNYPSQAQSKTIVGGLLDPNYEIIASLNPDLIIMTVEGNSKLSYESLKKSNYKIFISNPRNLDGIIKMINDIGKILNKEKNAINILDKLNKSRDSIKTINNIKVKNDCIILISLTPLITVNSSTYINEIIELSGFKNIYAEEKLPYPQINREDLVLKNPEYIILPVSSDSNIKNKSIFFVNDNLSGLDAVRKRKIIFVDEDIVMRPGPRIFEAIYGIINQFARLQ
jgi:iron complex transport system substrate-binding protein